MKESVKRLTTGFIFMVVLILVLCLNNAIVDSVFVLLLSIMGVYEYNKCFKAKGYNPISIVGYISCFGILLLGADIDVLTKINIIAISIPILLTIMFSYIVIKKLKVNIIDLVITFFSIIYVPFLFSFIKLLFLMPHGRIFIILAFASSISTDTFAYEIGSRLGKHKLSEVVSPKKSIEGSIAGIIGSTIICSIVAVITNTYFGTNFNIILIAIMGFILSIVGQIGDLAASSIKRFCGVKDFSNIMPGHGGILDRFDSVMFIAPILYSFIYIFSLI